MREIDKHIEGEQPKEQKKAQELPKMFNPDIQILVTKIFEMTNKLQEGKRGTQESFEKMERKIKSEMEDIFEVNMKKSAGKIGNK